MKKAFICTLLTTALLLCSCSSSSGSQGNASNNSAAVKSTGDITGFSLDSFDIENDYQISFANNTDMIATKDGYYYFKYNFLYFLDRKSMRAVPVCTKPDCVHDADGSENEDCNAYFSYSQFHMERGIAYANGNVYLLGSGSETDKTGLYLYRVSKDGSSREQVRHIMNFGTEFQNMPFFFTLHRGWCYYSFSSAQTAELYRFRLDSDEKAQKIDEISGTGAQFYRIMGCENGISYQYGSFPDDKIENYEDYEGGIKIFMGSKPEILLEHAFKSYVITNGNVYYETANGLKVYNIKSGATKDFNLGGKLYESYEVSFDGNYFYLFDRTDEAVTAIDIYDANESLVMSIEKPQNCDFFYPDYGDDKLYFCTYAMNGEDGEHTAYFEKDKIKDKSASWQNLE